MKVRVEVQELEVICLSIKTNILMRSNWHICLPQVAPFDGKFGEAGHSSDLTLRSSNLLQLQVKCKDHKFWHRSHAFLLDINLGSCYEMG